MGNIKEIMRHYGHDTIRKRFQIYAGAALGVLTPIALVRWGCGSGYQANSFFEEGLALAVATVLALPFMTATVPMGAAAGIMSSQQLSAQRKERESRLAAV